MIVLWTNKSNFKVPGSERKTFVWHRTNKKMQEICLFAFIKHGGENVICFGDGKVVNLYKES